MKTICVDGIIGAGKTTFVEGYTNYLRSRGKKVLTVFEPVQDWIDNGMLALFYKDQTRWGYTFQTMVYESRITTINSKWTEYVKDQGIPDYVILDRSPATDELFMKLLYEDGNVTDVEFGLYLKWKDLWHSSLLIKPDRYVYINPSVSICMERLQKRGREEEVGVLEEYQNKLAVKHDKMFLGRQDVACVGDKYTYVEVYEKLR